MIWFEAIPKVATGIAALVGAWVALQGLRAWRVQLHGKTEYDLARRVLRGVFRVRDQIAYVRSPFVPAGEMIDAYKSAGLDPNEINLLNDTKRRDELVYQRRWQPLAAALSELSLEILEAEVLWGQPVRACERALKSAVGELNAAISLYLRDIHTNNLRQDTHAAERMEKQLAIVYTGLPPDEFGASVEKTVKSFEDLLRPHLHGGRRGHAGQAA